jgi:hypothetical protein
MRPTSCRSPGPVWSRLKAVVVWVLVASASAQVPSKPSESHLVLLDGSTVPYRSLSIESGKLAGDGVPKDLMLDDLRRIEPGGRAVHEEKAGAVVELGGGGRIQAKSVAIANEKCQVESAGGQSFSLPVDVLRAIRLDLAAPHTEFEKALAAPSAELDRVLIKDEAGKLSSVAGLTDALNEEQLTLQVGGQNRQVPRQKVFGVVFARPAATDKLPRCMVAFRDGSVIGGETLSLLGDKATLTLAVGSKVEFAWSQVSRVTIRSNRVSFLSDLKPTEEVQQPIVTLPLPAQRDQSVSGGVLTLGTRTYEKGLGVHARSSLTFAIDRKWDAFAATIGLDAEAHGKGDCIFIVLGDGEPLLTRRMKGTDPPEEIQLAITGREKVTLTVEPGEGLDLADHADWCEARIIRNK